MSGTAEPVEISIRMRAGEWTQQSLEELVRSYQLKLAEMGAPEGEIQTVVDTPDDGSASVHVSWQHSGVRTFSEMGHSTVEESSASRGDGEAIAAGEPTKDSQGLGAVLGDAERSAIDEPATERSIAARENQSTSDYSVHTDSDGKTYVEDIGPTKV